MLISICWLTMQEGDALPETLQFLGPDKVRERDPVLRMMCVEILLLLATSTYLRPVSSLIFQFV